ncbi:hypothetical protein [Nostoc sp.]
MSKAYPSNLTLAQYEFIRVLLENKQPAFGDNFLCTDQTAVAQRP